MVPSWFLPALSREEAEAKLLQQNPGSFLIRQSSHTGSLALSVNTGKSGENGVQHFIINSRDGCVALEDSDLEFDSLVSLVNYYTSNREELPVALKLHTHERKISAPVGMRRGDSPYVSMVGKQRTKSTIWINSPAFRSSDDESSTLEKDLEVIKTVLQQNSVLDLDLQNLENEQAQVKDIKNNNDEVKVITQSESIDTSWKDASKSWLDSSRFWLDACKPARASTDTTEPETTSVTAKDTWQERLEKDGGKSTVAVNEVEENVTEVQENEYEDYSLPIDIQNTSNIYEDPDIVRSNMVQARPSTKIVYDSFNANKNKAEGPLSLPNSDISMTKNKISLPVSSPTNVSAPRTPATKQIPSYVTTPPGYVSSPPSFVSTASTRQPLEPFQPIRKLSYNHSNFNRHERLVRSPYGVPGKLESGTRSAEYRPRFRKNNSVMCPPPFRSLDNNKMASTNLSKSCSDLLKEIEKKNGPPIQQNELRKSFVRKVSLNLSVRKSNSKPIRKISDAMNKIFSMPKMSVKSLLNSQVNSDSWEYLAECGVNPVYEEVQEHKVKDSEESSRNINKAVLRCMSVDSLYESENSNSNSSSMSRENAESPSLEKSSSEHRLKSSSSGENRNKVSPTKQNISQRASSKNVGRVAEKILFV